MKPKPSHRDYVVAEEQTEEKERRSSAFRQYQNWREKSGMMICGVALGPDKYNYIVESLLKDKTRIKIKR